MRNTGIRSGNEVIYTSLRGRAVPAILAFRTRGRFRRSLHIRLVLVAAIQRESGSIAGLFFTPHPPVCSPCGSRKPRPRVQLSTEMLTRVRHDTAENQTAWTVLLLPLPTAIGTAYWGVIKRGHSDTADLTLCLQKQRTARGGQAAVLHARRRRKPCSRPHATRLPSCP